MAEKPKKQKKKQLEPFWKKNPQLKSISEHIGKFADRLTVKDLEDLVIMASLAYLSYDTFKTTEKQTESYISGYTRVWTPGRYIGGVWKYPIDGEPWERVWVPTEWKEGYWTEKPVYATREVEVTSHNPLSALIGPIGYRLATTMGGTPPVSQIAGLAVLAALGVTTLVPGVMEIFKPDVTGVPRFLSGLGPFGVGHLGTALLVR